MEQQGEYLIPAPKARVWAALNDPQVLAGCIQGCQEMQRLDDSHFDARVKARVGPVSATFDVALELQDVRAPDSYRIVGNVKGGAAGFARGEAVVKLDAAEADGTRLTYTVEAAIGGKLAQVGSRLIDAATRKMADEFFAQFRSTLAPASPPPLENTDDAPVERADRQYEGAPHWKIWVVIFAVFLLAMVLAY
ncbi:MAG: carbon monoxide dehydrogenase subunit G [Pseudomonadales bacterium]|nr:carbon monoxide dehydrogenase subunit G [Pseudomonadales bacterium]MCP5182886.1 carbon monoxide dehydrogenase subunit G [Pseudomonadales bacterium]